MDAIYSSKDVDKLYSCLVILKGKPATEYRSKYRAKTDAELSAELSQPQLLEGTGLGPVLRGIEQDGLWVNRELTPGLPMFGAAVRENGELRALILLHDAAGEQLSLYYQNMFRILCGLAETAMVRAGTKPAAKQEVRV